MKKLITILLILQVMSVDAQNNGGALKYADESLKKDKEFVLEAVRNNGGALEYADESLKKDKDVVRQALKNIKKRNRKQTRKYSRFLVN